MAQKLDEYRAFLTIDKEDLDACLMEQPEIYDRVAQEVVRSASRLDGIKLELEELQASRDKTLRESAARKGERTTEGGLQNELKALPEIQAKHRDYLAMKEESAQWAALKEAFQQRSFMLREIVALFIAQRHDLALEGGSGQSRALLAESNRKGAAAFRRARRAEK